MAAWLIPALKAILPHLGTIITVAKPVFTRKETETEPNPALLMQQQIEELQLAASGNAENTRELAAQLQGTVKAIEQAALVAQARLQRVFVLSLVACALSLVAVGVAMLAFFAR
ncbi:MAG: hypothetical protein ACMG6H_04865 [Acidobacteriota bacterium]